MNAELLQVANTFWYAHRSTLERNGCDRDDVRQQAYLEWWRLRIKWDVNKTHYVKERLIDWMRSITQWHKKTRSAPWICEYDVKYDTSIVEIDLGLEMGEIVKAARMMLSKTHDVRMLYILNSSLEGYTQAAISQSLGVSQALVSLLYTQFIDEMRQQLKMA